MYMTEIGVIGLTEQIGKGQDFSPAEEKSLWLKGLEAVGQELLILLTDGESPCQTYTFCSSTTAHASTSHMQSTTVNK